MVELTIDHHYYRPRDYLHQKRQLRPPHHEHQRGGCCCCHRHDHHRDLNATEHQGDQVVRRSDISRRERFSFRGVFNSNSLARQQSMLASDVGNE